VNNGTGRGRDALALQVGATVDVPAGCEISGYRARCGVFEILRVMEEVRALSGPASAAPPDADVIMRRPTGARGDALSHFAFLRLANRLETEPAAIIRFKLNCPPG
jgi:hypothetical protein